VTFAGSVVNIRDKGDEAEITLVNVRRRGAAAWREYGPEVSFRIPLEAAAAFRIGRSVRIKVTPK